MTLFLAFWIALPFFLYTQRAEYEGMVPMRLEDEGAYYDRIQTALLGRYDEVDNGITGPGIRGVGSSLVELGTGFLLRGSGLHGPEAGVLLMVCIAPLFFVFFSLFLRRLGISAARSLVLTALLTVMVLAPLQRPVNLSFTFPFTAVVLLLFSKAVSDRHWIWIAVSAVTIAILPSIYFWAWTFLWAVIAVFYGLHFFCLPRSAEKNRQMYRMFVTGGIALLLTLPLLFKTWVLQVTNPAFADTASNRSGFYHTYSIESIPRSALLLFLVIAAFALFLRKKEQRATLLFPVSLIAGSFLALHQNLLHGKDLMFSSHYYPFICLSAIALSAWVLQYEKLKVSSVLSSLKQWPSFAVLGITSLLLVAGYYDYRLAWSLPFADSAHLVMQHLAPALRHLDDGQRHMILSDRRTSLMVKAWTDDDVVFTAYVQSLLVSDTEYIERSCLTQLLSPTGPDVHAIARELTQYRGLADLPRRVQEVTDVCDRLFTSPAQALRKYKVELLLWNERETPLWVMDPLLFEKQESGDGWSMWKVKGR